jgi:hypothetical protein
MQDKLRNAKLTTLQERKGACPECGGRLVSDKIYNMNGGGYGRFRGAGVVVKRSGKYCLDCGAKMISWWKRLSPTERMMHFLRVGKYDPSR